MCLENSLAYTWFLLSVSFNCEAMTQRSKQNQVLKLHGDTNLKFLYCHGIDMRRSISKTYRLSLQMKNNWGQRCIYSSRTDELRLTNPCFSTLSLSSQYYFRYCKHSIHNEIILPFILKYLSQCTNHFSINNSTAAGAFHATTQA